MTRNRLSASTKADSILTSDGLFLLYDAKNNEQWVVKGSKHHNYTVVFNKLRKAYNCDCKNIRMIDCSHILAVKRRKGVENGMEEHI